MSSGEELDDAVRRAAPIRGLLGQLAARISGGSYREAACFADVHMSGLELDVHCASDTARVRIVPARGGYRVEIVAEHPASERAPEATLVRLARWIRKKKRAPSVESDTAWARALTKADRARGVRVDRAGGVLALAITVPRIPNAGQLERWLDAARKRVAEVKR